MANRATMILGLALAGLVLAGCADGLQGGLFARRDDGPRAPAEVRVMSNSFTIAGPKGFCIDNGGTRESDDGAFAVLGSCAVISGNPHDAKPRHPAMLTASVVPTDAALDDIALDRMAAFFSTEAGRVALARSDGAEEVSVIDLERDDGMLLVHAEDGDQAGDVTGDYWRGVFETAGQLVTVTVSGYRAAPLEAATGAGLARSFATAIRKANPEVAPEPAPQEAAPSGGPVSAVGERLASFFNRLP